MIVELLLPLVMAAIVGYGGFAYRFDLPSPIPSRHDRALVRIAELEMALGINQPLPPRRAEASDFLPPQYVQVARSPYTIRDPYKSPGRNEIPPNSRPGQQDLA